MPAIPLVAMVGGAIAASAGISMTAIVVGGAIFGAVAGGIVAAVKGGNILEGALFGAVGGALGAWGGASLAGAMGWGSAGSSASSSASAASGATVDAGMSIGEPALASTETTAGLSATGQSIGAPAVVNAAPPAAAQPSWLATAKEFAAPTMTLLGDTIKGYGEGVAAEEQANASAEQDELAYQRSLRTNSGLDEKPWAPDAIRPMTERLQDMTGVLNLNATGLLAQNGPAPVGAAPAPGAQVANPMGQAVAPAPQVPQVPQPLLTA